jgi:glycosyltransferase involved in cell wall biosynthesis
MKRVDLTIAAFAQVARKLPSAHLAIAGPDDGEETRLRQLTTELGMNRRVHFLGLLARSELLQLYSDADLLTLLSWRENFGMVVLEGMAAGLPALVGTEIGLAQEVQAAGAGCVVGDEADAIARAWSGLITNKAQRMKCAEAGRLLVARSFSTEAVARRMLSLLEAIVAQPRSSSSPDAIQA